MANEKNMELSSTVGVAVQSEHLPGQLDKNLSLQPSHSMPPPQKIIPMTQPLQLRNVSQSNPLDAHKTQQRQFFVLKLQQIESDCIRKRKQNQSEPAKSPGSVSSEVP
eukprot:CAMPEP_0202732034 /NCGR_PEP_ID=MMETSP1385-20130828/187451_1 /ASSEMBLY_ACC=CAM_ASM_000861 /TAXON_ID=933848 /ORGANISM="Elphidium margaritaceum" /LENGTH=107 /DNA_ID=CAMNT_0049398337 /DNA_START=1208 /DNA_END=1531 /DNA_ORIENTATION=-